MINRSYLILILFCLPTFIFAQNIEVYRLNKFIINPAIKKIFISPNLIADLNDTFGFKQQILNELQKSLNQSGRYIVTIGEPQGYDPNTETVAVIQGDITSSGEVTTGQFTEKAVCKGGISGIVGAATARGTSEQGLTFSRGRGFLCKRPNLQSLVAESAIEFLTGASPVDEVARIYKYKNVSIFLQTNLSITQLGEDRKTLLIRTDSANYSQHYPEARSFRNVRESSTGQFLILALFSFAIPVVPVPESLAVVDASNPGSNYGKYYEYVVPDPRDIPPQEIKQVRKKMATKVLKNFVRSLVPYKILIEAEPDDSGNSNAFKLIGEKKYERAKSALNNISNKRAADWYNFGLATEATAQVIDDFEAALLHYSQAYDLSPNSLYASAIGRIEKQVRFYKQMTDK